MSFIPEEKGFFGRAMDRVSRAIAPPPDPKEAVQKWSRQIRSEGRAIDRSIRGARLVVRAIYTVLVMSWQTHRATYSQSAIARV